MGNNKVVTCDYDFFMHKFENNKLCGLKLGLH